MKRTLDNCALIKRHSPIIGKPNQYDGKCEGYCTEDSDETCDHCKYCKLNIYYDEVAGD